MLLKLLGKNDEGEPKLALVEEVFA